MNIPVIYMDGMGIPHQATVEKERRGSLACNRVLFALLLVATCVFAWLAWRNAYAKPCDRTEIDRFEHYTCIYDLGAL